MNELKVNLRNLSTSYGVYVDGSLSYNKPKKNVETISIPGRSGDLVIDYGTFQNVIITYPCYIRGNFDTQFNALMNYLGSLTGYHKIECTNDTTHFRYGVPIIAETPTVKRIGEDGFFDLSFNCKPFRYLTSGETPKTTYSYTVQNPTEFKAFPVINVTGYGTITIQSQDVGAVAQTITIASNTLGPIRIDCDAMLISAGNNNPYPYVTMSGDYPYIDAYYVDISFSNTFSSVALYPKWREL